jgi:dsRNA-specific ribonuclease
MLSAVEDTLGHRFAQRRLLAEALTHCSWPDRSLPCNQRLELLGDAVLDLLITRHYALAWRLPPGRLTVLRSACLNNGRLAAAAAAHGLQRFLRHASQDLFAEVGRFVAHVRREVDSAAARHAAGQPAAGQPATGQPAARAPGGGGGGGGGGPAPGAAAAPTLTLTPNAGGAGRGAGSTEALRAVYDGMVAAGFGQGDALAAPKVLGDMVEALVGAVFLDAGQDLEATWAVVARLLQPMPHPDTVPIHPVSVLMERCQQAGVSLAYEREPSAQPGCVSVSAVVDGRAVGRCAAALDFYLACCGAMLAVADEHFRSKSFSAFSRRMADVFDNLQEHGSRPKGAKSETLVHLHKAKCLACPQRSDAQALQLVTCARGRRFPAMVTSACVLPRRLPP